MKTNALFLILFLLFFFQLSAQHVGVNNNNPQVSLDVTGALALRPDSVSTLSSQISLVDVTNRSYVKFTSNSADSSTRSIKLSAGQNGQIVTLEFTGTGAARLINGSYHSGGGRVLLNSDMVFSTYASLITLVFNNNTWKELYRNTRLMRDTDSSSVTYNTPGLASFIVPPGVQQIKVSLSGGGGYSGGNNGTNSGIGGNGGFVSGYLPVTEGQVYEIYVGPGGGPGLKARYSYIKLASTYLALAAGGGSGSRNGGAGGYGGPSGGTGSTGSGASGSGGGGATPTSGGIGGTSGGVSAGGSGSALTGGTVSNYSGAQGEGWGGDGWFGGGASGTYNIQFSSLNPWASGGGGGGSNYAGGLSSVLLNNSAGALGGTNSQAGSAGMIKIEW